MSSTAPIIVLDTPRTFSHLFGKFFDAHPDLDYYYRPYLRIAINASKSLTEGVKSNCPDESPEADEMVMKASPKTKDLKETPAQVADELLRRKTAAERDHVFCVLTQEAMLNAGPENHEPDRNPWTSNPTQIPGSLLHAAQVVILIRHPAKILSSGTPIARDALGLKPGDREFSTTFTLRWARLLFDYLRSAGREPIIVSGEDIVGSPEALLDTLSELLSVDRNGLRISWPLALPQERPTGPLGPWQERVSASTGVERRIKQDETPDLDIDKQIRNWKAEFGERDADLLRGLVDVDMPHYRYLERKKVLLPRAKAV